MSSKAIVSSIMALSLTMGGLAFAQRDEPLPLDDQQNPPGH